MKTERPRHATQPDAAGALFDALTVGWKITFGAIAFVAALVGVLAYSALPMSEVATEVVPFRGDYGVVFASKGGHNPAIRVYCFSQPQPFPHNAVAGDIEIVSDGFKSVPTAEPIVVPIPQCVHFGADRKSRNEPYYSVAVRYCFDHPIYQFGVGDEFIYYRFDSKSRIYRGADDDFTATILRAATKSVCKEAI